MKKFECIRLFTIAALLSISFPFSNQLFGLNENVDVKTEFITENKDLSECAFELGKQQHDNVILFPEASGFFAMGYKNIELTDTNRNDPYDIGKNRRLKVTFYYPATAISNHLEPYGEEEATFWGRELAAIPSLKESFEEIMGQIRALRVRKSLDAEPLSGKYPVLIFNHGFGITSGSYQSLFQELVSHGYIVCAIHNPYIADTVIFQNEDRLFRKAERNNIAVDTCLNDVTFVLSLLSEIEYFRELMDLDKVGMLGHSLGGITTMKIARTSHQVKAAVQLDAPIEDLSEYEDGSIGFDKPFLHLFANETSFLKTSLNVNNFKALIIGAAHNSFADHEVLGNILPFFKEEGKSDLTQYHTIVALIRLFFDQFLKNDPASNLMSFNNQNVLLETS